MMSKKAELWSNLRTDGTVSHAGVCEKGDNW